MRNGIFPSSLTFPFLIKECTARGDLVGAGAVYGHAVKLGFHGDVFIQNAMISLYCKCGVMDSARNMFDEIPNRDVVSWNSMIVGYFRNGYTDFALDLVRRMEERSIYTWNSIITGCVQAGCAREALEFFQEMMSEGAVEPDKMTISSVLTACSSLGAVDHGKWVHGYLNRIGLELDVVIGTALIDMYGKSGCVETAAEVFEKMIRKDVLAWTAMISVFSYHGYARKALNLLKEMDTHGLKPNHVTFVALLSACAHSGLVDEGRRCFHMMRNVYLIEPHVFHYACMVDVFSRAALFEEAERVIQSMPMQPDAFVWGALLGGCQMHGNTELGERVALKLIELDRLNYAFYVNLCDVYAKAGRFNDVKKIRALMQQKGMKKKVPGCSMIEVDGIVYEFSVRGAPEVEMEEIVLVLEGLVGQKKLDTRAAEFDDRDQLLV